MSSNKITHVTPPGKRKSNPADLFLSAAHGSDDPTKDKKDNLVSDTDTMSTIHTDSTSKKSKTSNDRDKLGRKKSPGRPKVGVTKAQYTLTMEPELYNKVRSYASEKGVSIAKVMKEAVEEFFKSHTV